VRIVLWLPKYSVQLQRIILHNLVTAIRIMEVGNE
jgi:hypothetical protein